jgi:hypothetical protein
MKTFFDKSHRDELQERLNSLSAESKSNWGKMSSAQMLAHCTAAMQVPVGDLPTQWSAYGLIGWMLKGMIYNEKPFVKNAPTGKEFRISTQREFDQERARFIEAFQKLALGPSNICCHKHPFFGKMTDRDWGHLIYKHLDHHFQQFGI